MAGSKRRILAVLGAALVTGYLGLVGLMWSAQDKVLFPAPTIERAELAARAEAWGATEVELIAADGTPLYAVHQPGKGYRALIYLHGNGATAYSAPEIKHKAARRGWDVISLSYRGYPGSQGAPSQAGLALDAMAAWKFVVDELGIPPERIVVHGMSLGGGVAGTLMGQVEPAGWVLQSTFTSVEDRAREQYPFLPIGWLLRHPFSTRSKAPLVRAPVLILHGEGDAVVPVHHGRELATLFSHATYVEEPRLGHNTVLPHGPRALAAWDAFLKESVPRRKKGRRRRANRGIRAPE